MKPLIEDIDFSQPPHQGHYLTVRWRLRCKHCSSWEHSGVISHSWSCKTTDLPGYPKQVRAASLGHPSPPEKMVLGRVNPAWLKAALATLPLEQDEAWKKMLAKQVSEAQQKQAEEVALPGQILSAKYRGTCALCGTSIAVGTPIHWHLRQAAHMACAEGQHKAMGPTVELDSFEDHQDVVVGAVMRHPYGSQKGKAIVPISRTRRYIREDGLSLGLNEDSGYLYRVVYREATADEKQAFETAEAERVAKEAEQARRYRAHQSLRRAIQDRGSKPDKVDPQGEEFPKRDGRRYDTTYLVVGESKVWLVEYNGRDGDCWAWSNHGSDVVFEVDRDKVEGELREAGVVS